MIPLAKSAGRAFDPGGVEGSLRSPRARSIRPCVGTAILFLALSTGAGAENAAPGLPRSVWEQRIREVDALLLTAHFHTALALARSTLAQLEADSPDPRSRRARARLEVMSATAAVALGDLGAAQEGLVRALRAEPELSFDEQLTSPKLRELVPEARRRAGRAQEE